MRHLLLPLLLALALTGCTAAAPPRGSGADTMTEGENALREQIIVADAACYRGTVTAIEEREDGLLLTLETYPGTSGKGGQFLLPADTPRSFEDSRLTEGVYLEVYYGVPVGSPDPELPEIIGANLYPEAAMVILNGTVLELPDDIATAGEGRILLQQDEGQQVAVNYGAETQFYLNLGDLQVGDHLSILHSGRMTRSLPPQIYALEVRRYAEEQVGLPNPIVGLADSDALFEATGLRLTAPAAAEDFAYSAIGGTVAQLRFDWRGAAYTLRASVGEGDISGVCDRLPDEQAELALADGTLALLEPTASGGRLVRWQWGGAQYSLYTPAAVTDEALTELLAALYSA